MIILRMIICRSKVLEGITADIMVINIAWIVNERMLDSCRSQKKGIVRWCASESEYLKENHYARRLEEEDINKIIPYR